MNKKLKTLTAVAMTATMMITALMTGCGKSGQETSSTAGNKDDKVTIEFWTIQLRPNFDDYFNKLFAAYKKDHQNVDIKWVDLPFDTISSKLLSAIAGNASPDVVNLNTEKALNLAAKNGLVDFDKVLTKEQKDAYLPGLYNSTKNGNGIYALPWYTGGDTLYINKDLAVKAGLDVNNPPKTMDEMNQWSKQIKEKTGKYGYMVDSLYRSLVIDGVQLLNDDKTKAAFNTPEAADILKKNAQLIKDGYCPKQPSNYDNQIQNYSAGNMAMVITDSGLANTLKSQAPDIYKNTIITTAPVGKGNITFAPTMNVVVPTMSKHKKEAEDFSIFLTNNENQLAFDKATISCPTTKAGLEDPFFKNSTGDLAQEALIMSAQSLKTATDFTLGIKAQEDVFNAITKAVENVYFNGGDPQKELTAAEKSVNDILQKNQD